VSCTPKFPCLLGERLRLLEVVVEVEERVPEVDDESLDSLSDSLCNEGSTPQEFGIRALLRDVEPLQLANHSDSPGRIFGQTEATPRASKGQSAASAVAPNKT
jgi:hypothetical protein